MLFRSAIAPTTDALVREVLEDLRDVFGSEAVFLAGRVDRIAATDPIAGTASDDPSARPPDHGQAMAQAQLLFCWMGNVTAQVFGEPCDGEPLRIPRDDRNRWSTARRLQGTLQVASGVMTSLDRLIVHTDGADSLSSSITTLSDSALQERAQQLLASPGSDDITILDVQWHGHRPPG